METLALELARQNARDAGLADRVTFDVRDIAEAEAGAYDLAVIIEAVHDMTQPAGVLASIRRMLRPDGVALIAVVFYGFSILTCLPAAMTEQPTAAIGTVMRADTMRRLGAEAGFRDVERLDEPELDMLRFYRMTP